ncbi:MAG: hypothetical protein DRJ61_07665 [Acidobacteria bacterium]|nr:MAG: hypothetical protein DRJ61_07665 [Acidobacteriota bacterium]
MHRAGARGARPRRPGLDNKVRDSRQHQDKSAIMSGVSVLARMGTHGIVSFSLTPQISGISGLHSGKESLDISAIIDLLNKGSALQGDRMEDSPVNRHRRHSWTMLYIALFLLVALFPASQTWANSQFWITSPGNADVIDPYDYGSELPVDWDVNHPDYGPEKVTDFKLYVDGSNHLSTYSTSTQEAWVDFADLGCAPVIRVWIRFFVSGVFPHFVDLYSEPIQIYIDDVNRCLPEPENCEQDVGGPIDVASGHMWYDISDLQLGGAFPINLSRRYRSDEDTDGSLGIGWRHSYMMSLEVSGGSAKFHDAKGRTIPFGNALGSFYPNHHAHLNLTDTGSGYEVHDPRIFTTYAFNALGTLTSITNRDGLTQTLTYNGGLLESVTGPHGRSITFAYDVNNRLDTVMANPGNTTISYTIDDTAATLDAYIDPTGETWTYDYNDPVNPNLLTDISDPLGHLIEGHTYDVNGRVIAFTGADEVGKLELSYDSTTQTTVTTYTSTNPVVTSIAVYTIDPTFGAVTDIVGSGCPYGGGEEKHITWDKWLNRLSETNATGKTTEYAYYLFTGGEPPSGGAPYSIGTIQAMTEAAGTPSARTTTYHYESNDTGYHRTQIVRESVAKPGDMTTTNFALDPNSKRVLTKTDAGWIDATTSEVRTTTFTYDFGQTATVDGPRTDITDVTTTTYYPDTASNIEDRGMPYQRTDSEGNVTTYERYILWGSPAGITDPNGVVTSLSYDDWGRLTTSTIVGKPPITTTYSRDEVGRIDQITYPRGNVLAYTYDNSGRLRYTERKAGVGSYGDRGYKEYDLRNRVAHEEKQQWDKASAGYITHYEKDHLYDSCGRLSQTTNFDGAFTSYTYYADGQLETVTDPHSNSTGTTPSTTFDYDDLGRLYEVRQKYDATTDFITTYAYDTHDNLIGVLDAEGNETTYSYDDFSYQRSSSSPVTGLTTSEYDPAGNLTVLTHASGHTQTRSYDALNRLIEEQSTGSQPEETIYWTYDDLSSGQYGRGRLRSMLVIENNQKMAFSVFSYDRRGLVTKELQGIAHTKYALNYTYDLNGNEIGIAMDFAGGIALSYLYDGTDRPIQVWKVNTPSYTIAGDIEHRPFGPISHYKGGTYDYKAAPVNPPGIFQIQDHVHRDFDRSYHSTQLEVGHETNGSVLDRNLTWADGQNLTSLTDGSRSFSTSYDNLSRLTGFTESGGPSWSYTHDGIGNRLSKDIGGAGPESWSYTYLLNSGAGNTAVLDTVIDNTTPTTHQIQLDSDGSTTNIGSGQTVYSYSPRQKMTSENDGTNANSYEYDARGYLVRMTSDETSEHSDMRFIYDHRGRLMAILHGAAYQGMDRAYVWLEDQVLAQYRPSENPKLWWIVGDHLGTPALLYSTTSRYAKAWYSPYGELIQFDEIGGAAPSHDFRFPGQIDISTSGAIWPMYYNMNRWYMPGWGRYTQSDPLGLRGGVNLFLYANSSPMVMIDPEGLEWFPPPPSPGDSRREEARLCAQLAFFGNYMDMREANTIGADKYFHCKANCEAARCGPGGTDSACAISDAREAFDRWKGDPPNASADDQRANQAGRDGAIRNPHYTCRTVCAQLRPTGLPRKY